LGNEVKVMLSVLIRDLWWMMTLKIALWDFGFLSPVLTFSK